MKLELFDKINFHDAKIHEYKRDGNDIIFLIEDGWVSNTYFKVKLKNVKVEVMNNSLELVCYTLDVFNKIIKNGIGGYISSGKGDIIKDNEKYYLKLWIDHPHNMGIKPEITTDKYCFDKFNVSLCNDYDDTGNLYIKFIMDDFDIEKL